MAQHEIRSTCPYCGVGCGVLIGSTPEGGVQLRGDPDHPANRGRLCSKGSALAETLGPEGRLLAPMLRRAPGAPLGQKTGQGADLGGGAARRLGWDEALDQVAGAFTRAIKDHGPDSVALYLSGQLLTEDYYVANKLMKGFIGSANIDTNSRLCMASAVAGHRRAFGTDTVPGLYDDLEAADLVVLVGSNMAWCHPVLFQRLQAARQARGTKLVVIDPRRTTTADEADLYLPIAPGADAALFNLALAEAARRGQLDRGFLPAVEGLAPALLAAHATPASATGLAPDLLARFFDLWLGSEKVVTAWSQGINQSDSGSDKVNAILNLHLATGRIGRPGMGPLSLTGQPNAMGGREVGGLANMLACHLDLENADHRQAVQGFWAAPRMASRPGLKAVDMFRAVEEGKIRALWIMCTNPVVSMPEADRVARALAKCDFVVVSDMMAQTDTARLAHLCLPSTGWGEKDGTVTNSERRISRQRAFRPRMGAARPDWWQLAQVAQRMGFAGFDWSQPSEIFAEHAALSGVAGQCGRDFDISDHAGIDGPGYDALQPFLWPAAGARQGGRFFGDGRFHHGDGRARMIAVTPRLDSLAQPVAEQPKPEALPNSEAQPNLGALLRLNTGRVRDHWHTMSRTGLAPKLNQHMAEPYLELHPQDAAGLGVIADGLAMLRAAEGQGAAGQGDAANLAQPSQCLLRVLISDRVAPGQAFAPIHWTGETGPSGRVGAVIACASDPVSGQPASKSALVRVAPYRPAWFAYAVAARPFRPTSAYWARAVHARGMTAELAGDETPENWLDYALALFGLDPAALSDGASGGLSVQSLADPARGRHRLAFLHEGKLVAALFVDAEPVALSRAHVAGLLGDPEAPGLLSGRPGADRPDPGPTVCACFSVGVNTIVQAIAEGGCLSLAALAGALKAGSNCGACRPELSALIARHSPALKEAAE